MLQKFPRTPSLRNFYFQTLVTLRYLAKGFFFSETGDLHGVSRSSASRCVSEGVSSINRRLNNIAFPSSEVDVSSCKRKFHQIAGLPNVVGDIDGTLIPKIAPTGIDEPTYVYLKGYHAINVQVVAHFYICEILPYIARTCLCNGEKHACLASKTFRNIKQKKLF